MQIRKLDLSQFETMGECRWQLLYPWKDVADTPFYSGWTHLEPGTMTQPHQHHEYETYFIAQGTGEMRVEGEAVEVNVGDVIYMPPFNSHVLVNTQEEGDLLFLSVFWEDLDRTPAEKKASEERERSAKSAVLTLPGASPAVTLAADVHRRYLAQQGVAATAVTMPAEGDGGDARTLTLGEHAKTLQRFHLDSRISPALRAAAERVLAEDDPAVPVTAADETVAARWATLDAGSDATVFVHRDDALRAALGIPALALGAGASREALPTALVEVTETVPDGAGEGVAEVADDAHRWAAATGASPDAAAAELAEWREWAAQMHGRLTAEYDGKVPSTGYYTDEQHHFHRRLLGRVARVAEGYEARSFSLAQTARELRDLVWDVRRFADAETVWIGVPERSAERRTSVALELTAARALAYLAAPLLPGFAAELWGSLHEAGQEPELSSVWDEVPGWVAPGSEPSGSIGVGGVGAGAPAGT